jgi:pimeloyl-ACP methyl ester carboxylesterase
MRLPSWTKCKIPRWLISTSASYLDLGELWRFSSPVLLTEGDQSPPWFPKIMAELAGAIDGAERLTFTGAGPVPHQTHPDEYVRAVVEFTRAR